MKGMIRIAALALSLLLAACATVEVDHSGTIAELRGRRIEIGQERIGGGLEKAMASYRRFLEETPDSPLAPEAIRRLADLKVEREYGLIADGNAGLHSQAPSPLMPGRRSQGSYGGGGGAGRGGGESSDLFASDGQHLPPGPLPSREGERAAASVPEQGETVEDFESRATRTPNVADVAGADDLNRAGAVEAIELYRKLLADYPAYKRNDQVLYQMSRAYEELGRIEEAMEVMDRMVKDYPASRYLDEVQFRRGEYFFVHRKYLDAEDAYRSIVEIGVGSSFFDLALYKLGWTFYKQELYEEALDEFIALLDNKVSAGYDFAQTEDEPERKRTEDTFRVISLSFSYLGGADAVVDYFSRRGRRSYENRVYAQLAEYYFDKRRYSDATAAYNAFVSRNPFHEQSPRFHMRVIEIDEKGAFPSLVIEAKKAFATNYGLQAEYWQHFKPSDRPEVLADLKTNLIDLANHYHALYQKPPRPGEKEAHFAEALRWYRAFLVSFPQEDESPAINYQMADLLLENGSPGEAAVEYEKTAYDYPAHEKSATAGYAAVYAWRRHLAAVASGEKDAARQEVVRSSLAFAEAFPQHEKAAIVLGAAADDLYAMGEHERALAAGRRLIELFPAADAEVRRAAWLVIAHSCYELNRYPEAEEGYGQVLALLPEEDPARAGLVDNLAAAIYKQGEQANRAKDYRAAAEHFLRVGRLAPTSSIRPNAEFDAATALILLEDWPAAAAVLTAFREAFPGHELQPEVTKKIAYVYRLDGKASLAAGEYERIERESRDDEVRREALLTAAELYREAGSDGRALEVYRRYAEQFSRPVELNLETRDKIAALLKAAGDRQGYLAELGRIVAIDGAAGEERTARTRHLAAGAALVLAELKYDRFSEVALVKPIEANLKEKQARMKAATRAFNHLLDYQVGDVTAAATFYLGEIYAHFSKALMNSERPEGLSPLELEQYELAIEEQAYPFEEQAIAVYESNLELVSRGIYNDWIDRSLRKLAVLVPARYDKPEQASGPVASLDTFTFAIDRPEPPAAPAEKSGEEAEKIKRAEGESALVEEEATVEEETQAEHPSVGAGLVPARAAAPVETPEQGVETKEKIGEVPASVAKTNPDDESMSVAEPATVKDEAPVGGEVKVGEKYKVAPPL